MFNEPVRMAYRLLPLRSHQFDPQQKASATQCRTSRKPERTKIDIFSAPCQWTHPRLSREASRTKIFRRQDTCQEPFPLLRRHFGVKDRVHLGLAALTCELLFDFVAVNRVHDNDVIR